MHGPMRDSEGDEVQAARSWEIENVRESDCQCREANHRRFERVITQMALWDPDTVIMFEEDGEAI